MIVLKIKYKNNWYYVEQNNKKFDYYRIDGNNKDYNLNIDEVKMIKTAIDSITPSNIRIKLMDYIYKGQKYEVSYDPKTELRFFNPLPKLEILFELNMLFNNQSEYLYDDKITNEKKPKNFIHDTRTFFKRLADYKAEIITILVAGTLLFQSTFGLYELITKEKYNNYIKSLNQTIAMDDHDYLNSFFDAIYINPYLSNQEKKYLFNYYSGDLLLDNKNYIDFDTIINRLSTLKINYSKEASPKGFSAIYNSTHNTIVFYNINNLNEVKKQVFSHEAYHVLSHNTLFYNSFLVETLNTQLNEEYAGEEEANIYKYYIHYTSALAEIIGPTPLKKYINYTEKKPIIDALVDVYGTESDANRLLANLENYKREYDNYVIKQLLSSDEAKMNLSNLNNQLVEQFATYYQAKYNRDYQDDLIMLFYLDEPKFNEILKEKFEISENTEITQIKNVSYLKNKDSELWFTHSGNNLIIIDENNRYLNEYEKKI